ncbi:MAG: amino acid/amide transporter ATP-binding protein 2, family [Ilumatobacteraceae bacterium]|nr:amino acid/amide transporter ATP-binding protein 2, family [Ilumatobacteraceae bacterium]
MTGGLDVDGVSAGYGAVEAIHDLTLRFPIGCTVALLGHNGAGKTSLLRVIGGSVAPTTGRVRWHGDDINDLAAHERVAAGITVIPDEPNVFAELTVDENIELFAEGAPHAEIIELIPALRGKGAQRAGTLSGGERQMLALARLLLHPGRAVLVDEITRGLSPAMVDRVYGMLDDLVDAERTIVVVDQYLPDILRRADLVYVLSRGRLAWAGEGSEVADGRLPMALAEAAQGV